MIRDCYISQRQLSKFSGCPLYPVWTRPPSSIAQQTLLPTGSHHHHCHCHHQHPFSFISSTVIHFHPPSSIFIHFYPFSSNIIHVINLYPFSSTIFHYSSTIMLKSTQRLSCSHFSHLRLIGFCTNTENENISLSEEFPFAAFFRNCPLSLQQLPRALQRKTSLTPDGKYSISIVAQLQIWQHMLRGRVSSCPEITTPRPGRPSPPLSFSRLLKSRARSFKWSPMSGG